VRDIGLRGHPDQEIVDRARAEGRVVLTADTDFASTLAFPPATHAGVVVLRVPDDWNSQRRAERLLGGIREVGVEALAGAVVIVEPSRSRIYSGPAEDAP
jgi:predicted nuclease of predicted toxin-antitoxin system